MSEQTTPEERRKNRRLRRWKRRGRIVAPFAALPVLLGTLVLSVDFIEYRPEEPRQKLADRPLPPEPKQVHPSLAAQSAIAARAVSNEALLGDSGEQEEDVRALELPSSLPPLVPTERARP